MKTRNNQSVPKKNGKKKQVKGTKKANETISKEIIVCFNDLLKKVFKAWSLITKQDVMSLITKKYTDGITNLYFETELIYTNIHEKYGENMARVFKLLTTSAKLPVHIAHGLFYNLVNKPERASQEYKNAEERNDFISKLFQEIKNTMDEDFFSVFKFLRDFSNSIISILKSDSDKVLKYKERKYIDQVERFRHLAGRFRTVSFYLGRFDNKDKELKDLINDIRAFVVIVADACEENANSIEIDKKEIKFLPPIDKKVFIVHGHDPNSLQELKEILESYDKEDKKNKKRYVLEEMQDEGKTVIDKFEYYARYSAFTFVIITPDDVVTNKGKTYSQGRPNVFFELGWFCGRFGRDKVRVFKEKSVKMPSDLEGIITLNFEKSLKEVSEDIKKDLEDNGIIEKKRRKKKKKEENR